MKIVLLSYALANITLNFAEWKLLVASDSYRQRNSYDCGVFTCLHAASLIAKKNIPYDTSDDARNWIRWVISQKTGNQRSVNDPQTDDCVIRRLKERRDPEIEWKHATVFNEIVESVVHGKTSMYVMPHCANVQNQMKE